MNDSTTTPIAFSLVDITTEQFALIESNYDKNLNEYGIDLTHHYKQSFENRVFGVFSKFTFDQKDKPFLILESACHFKFSEESWQSFIKDENLIIAKELALHLLIISVGTARGIIHSKVSNIFDHVILPTLDISQELPEDIVFEIHRD